MAYYHVLSKMSHQQATIQLSVTISTSAGFHMVSILLWNVNQVDVFLQLEALSEIAEYVGRLLIFLLQQRATQSNGRQLHAVVQIVDVAAA